MVAVVLELMLEREAEEVEEKAVLVENSDALDMVFLRPFEEVLLEAVALEGGTGIVCVLCMTAGPWSILDVWAVFLG